MPPRKPRKVDFAYKNGQIKANVDSGNTGTEFILLVTDKNSEETKENIKLFPGTPKIIDRSPKDGNSYEIFDSYDNTLSGEFTFNEQERTKNQTTRNF